MKLLVIGSGGREHALVWKLAQSSHVHRMWCAPGNAGIAGERLVNSERVHTIPLGSEDLRALLNFAQEARPDLTVVGPDNPLALGIVDLFEAHGMRIWGPTKRAAEFEWSKAFSQDFMGRYGIPTARALTTSDPAAAKAFAKEVNGRCAVKADGLALGKGVVVTDSLEAAYAAVEEFLVRKGFGAAGERIVLQEKLEGTEISFHALCDGKSYAMFPTSQDHKRALDGNRGPNTGGMGAYSPAPFLNEAGISTVRRTIMEPWLRGCSEEGIEFHGILYPGVMLTESGPKVLEFNARFGDPETQVYMIRLENDLIELIEASLTGTLAAMPLRWRSSHSVCVVLASKGYPGTYSKGVPISGLDQAEALPDTKVFHAGTLAEGDRVLTNGGRVLGVTAWASDLSRARDKAYEAVEKIQFDGAQYRRDIGAQALTKS